MVVLYDGFITTKIILELLSRVQTLEEQMAEVKSELANRFESRIIAFLRRNSDVLEKLVAGMYARGLSTRDIEDAFRERNS